MRKKLRQQEGATLIEMIVSFTLLVILVTAVSVVIPSAMKIYYGVRTQHEQRTIAFSISNRIKSDLQSAVGIGNSMDGVSGEGYLCLRTGADAENVADISLLTSTNPLSGDTVEFVYDEGVMEQIDAKGFNGLVVRNNSRIRNVFLTKNNTDIKSNVLMSRYYTRNGGSWQKDIMYTSTNYSTSDSTMAGVLDESTAYHAAYAVESQYGEDFYRGYDVKINYEIPEAAVARDVEFTVHEGKKVKATFVKYVDFTVVLSQNGQMKYEQKFCANIENAVPYLGTLSTDITNGSGGNKTLEEIIEDYKGIFWRDPAELEGYPPVEENPSWGTVYTYMIAIAPPKTLDGSSADVSEWMAEISLGNYDINGTPYLVSLKSTNQWYTQHGSHVEYAYDSGSKKIILRGQSLLEGEIYKCLVQVQVKHEYQKPPSADEMMPDRYPVKITYWRNYVTGNSDGSSGNYKGTQNMWGDGSQLSYQMSFTTSENEKRLLTFDYTVPYEINDVNQINLEGCSQKPVGVSLTRNDDHTTTIHFRGFDVLNNSAQMQFSVSGLSLPISYEPGGKTVWDYKGTYKQVDSLPSITLTVHPDYPDYTKPEGSK